MLAHLRQWLDNLQLRNPIEQRSAKMLQIFMIGVILLPPLQIFLAFTPSSSGYQIPTLATILLTEVIMVAALMLLRRGHFIWATRILIGIMLLGVGLNLLLNGLRDNRLLLLAFTPPITLAGLLLNRRAAVLTTGSSLGITLAAGLLEQYAPEMIVQAAPPYSVPSTIILLATVMGLHSLFIDQFGSTLRAALASALEREQELEHMRASLESQINQRTAVLARLLADMEARAAEQTRMLSELERQRDTIRNLSVPVIPLDTNTLLVPLVGDLDVTRLAQFQDQALRALEHSSARTLVLDLTGVPIVDTQVAQSLFAVVRATRLLGAETLIAGIRPEVAQTIVGLGLDLQGMRTFSNLQSALRQAQVR